MNMKLKEILSLESIIQIFDNLNSLLIILHYDDEKLLFANKSGLKRFPNSLNKKIKDVLQLSNEEEIVINIESNSKLFDNKGKPKNSLKGSIRLFNSEYYNYEVFGISDNNKKYKILVLNELTEIKNNLEEAEIQNRMLGTIIDESPVAIWFFDNDANYKLINSFVKNNMQDDKGNSTVLNDESEIAYQNNLEVLKKLNYTIKYEPFTFRDGRIHQLKSIRKRIIDENGKKLGVIGIGIDITEIKNTEEKLKYLKELNELISEFSSKLIHCKVNNIDDYVKDTLKAINQYISSDRVYICDLNNSAKNVSISYEHYQTEDLKNIGWVELNYQKIERWIDLFNQNYYLLIHDVQQIPYSYSNEKLMLENRNVKSMLAFPLIYNSELIGFVGFDNIQSTKYWDNDTIFLLRIATEIIAGSLARKNFELRIINAMNAAEEASRTKSEFLANMSHEIRTPMNAILGFSEILQESITTGVQKSYLNTIINSGRNLMKLINDILDLSKIESGRIDIMPEPVDLLRIFSEIEKIFEIKIKDKRLEFIIDMDQDVIGYWLFDETRLRQILFNVVGNSIKFTDQGYIKISTRLIQDNSNKKNIELSVEDSGIGIPDEHQKRIFDSFYQVSSKSGKRYDGTGLGLAITMRLIKAMNGEIRLVSKPKIGTNFTITFNDVRQAELTIIKEQEFPEVSDEFSFNNARFLVVDDIHNNREMIKIFLEEYKGIVIESDNGNDAIKLASFYKPSAIILDIRMPGMSGFEVLHHIRNDERTIDIPVIALTAVSSAFQEKHLYKDFNAVLTKPVRKDELISKLSEIVG